MGLGHMGAGLTAWGRGLLRGLWCGWGLDTWGCGLHTGGGAYNQGRGLETGAGLRNWGGAQACRHSLWVELITQGRCLEPGGGAYGTGAGLMAHGRGLGM